MKKVILFCMLFAGIIKSGHSVDQSISWPNDPYKVKKYTLENGLTVFISENHNEPRIQTMIAVKAGSKFDPPQTTGLAHYLEHMLFKGTSKTGTINWEKESSLLKQISDQFEAHLRTNDPNEKKDIYKKIDSLSYEASKYAIPNEYDKMVSSLGASGTNAFTSNDMTVYVNEIPANALSKWATLESERMGELVLRLFHTELETVYEEFNRSADNDNRWAYYKVDSCLMPNHPYGTQTTIGLGEHLKNPSMVNIHKYFDTYYVPNNMAIILSGDVNAEEALEVIRKTWGSKKSASVPVFIKAPPVPIKGPLVTEYFGPQKEYFYLGYRFDGASSKDALMVKMVDMILANGTAGLIDLNLNQKQKVLAAQSFVEDMRDYTLHFFYGEAKSGQKMEEVKDLILGELEKIKKGEFDEKLMKAIVLNMKLDRLKAAESNELRAYALMDNFVKDLQWSDWVNELSALEKITKAEIVDFVKKNYGSNYAICYKRSGAPFVHKVDKPSITSVVMNKDTISAFKKKLDALPMPEIQPVFIDYDKEIKTGQTGNVELNMVENKVNGVFSLNYIFDMGTDHNKKIGLALRYLEYLGTTKYGAEELKKVLYSLALSVNGNSASDRIYLSLSGLEDQFSKGVELFEHILSDLKADEEVYQNLVNDILTERQNAKKNKGTILFSGLVNYAKFGELNPFRNQLSEQELKSITGDELVKLIKSLPLYKHRVYYYGRLEEDKLKAVLNKYHKTSAQLKEYPAAIEYKERDILQNEVYFCNYNMKQTELVMISKDARFDKSLYTAANIYNEYYGSGLSSIMFQEIREKMALAYSVYSAFTTPDRPDRSHYINSYIGTQVDKLPEAVKEMKKLLSSMPKVDQQFSGTMESVKKKMQTDRIYGSAIFWSRESLRKKGINVDIRKEIYENLDKFSFDQLSSFFNQHVRSKPMAIAVIGNKKDMNFEALGKLGTVRELSLEELFGY